MDETWEILTPDQHRIYGIKTSAGSKSEDALFIVHGLTSSMDDYVLKRAADYFGNDFDVFRFNLYDGRQEGRSLSDCTIGVHAQDLQTVLKKFGANYQRNFLIGHSYGGPTIMTANPREITAASLWDPSFDLKSTQEKFADCYTEVPQGYLVSYGVATLMGKAMYAEATRLDEAACGALAQAFNTPFQVIHAGDGMLVKSGKSYHSYASSSSRHDIVDRAGHSFTEDQTCDDLLCKTARWFDMWRV